LLAELEELEQQDLEEKLLDVGPSVELPSVPSALPSEPSRGMTMVYIERCWSSHITDKANNVHAPPDPVLDSLVIERRTPD